MSFWLDLWWYRIVPTLALMWLAAAGPMPAYAMTRAAAAPAALHADGPLADLAGVQGSQQQASDEVRRHGA